MNMKKINTFILSLASASAFAGGMGPAPSADLLILEAGFSYSHAFYKSKIRPAESFTVFTPRGVEVFLNDFYPDDFWGGYIGASYYMPGWLFNSRLDFYNKETECFSHSVVPTTLRLAPARLTFTIDKAYGNPYGLSYGFGGGAVVETINEGEFIATPTGGVALPSETLHHARIDPTVEVFAMYRMPNHIGFKVNLGYQIPANSLYSNGDVNLNLGVNYAFPV